MRVARVGWHVEVEVEGFGKHGSQNFLFFDPYVHVQKCGLLGAFRKRPFYATLVQCVLEGVPRCVVFGKVWVVAPDSEPIIDVSLQEWRKVGELLDDVFSQRCLERGLQLR